MASPGRPRNSRRLSADFRIYDDFRALPKAERRVVLRHLNYFMQDEDDEKTSPQDSEDQEGE